MKVEIFRSFYVGNLLKAEFKEKGVKISVEAEGYLGRPSIMIELSELPRLRKHKETGHGFSTKRWKGTKEKQCP